jgi:hypothetical protein
MDNVPHPGCIFGQYSCARHDRMLAGMFAADVAVPEPRPADSARHASLQNGAFREKAPRYPALIPASPGPDFIRKEPKP